MRGKGLLKGMSLTLKAFFSKKGTVQYPEAKLPMSPRFRGGELELDHKKCIACGLCAMACPNHVIELTTAVNEDKKKYLTSYVYHSGLCLYCNFCTEACPTKAICWDKNYENARYFREDLDVDCLSISQQKSVTAAEESSGTGKPEMDEQEKTRQGRAVG